MKSMLLVVALMLSAFQVFADKCDCSLYPFKPNPPCYGRCVAKLSSSKDTDLSQVKGIDAGVSVNIKVLSAEVDRTNIDFSGIRSKSDLEHVTLDAIKDIKLEAKAQVPKAETH